MALQARRRCKPIVACVAECFRRGGEAARLSAAQRTGREKRGERGAARIMGNRETLGKLSMQGKLSNDNGTGVCHLNVSSKIFESFH